MAPYYPFIEDQFSRGMRDPLVTHAPYVLVPKSVLFTVVSFIIAVIAGVFFGLIVMCAICKIGWFTPRQTQEAIGLPDWSQVQWRRIRMRIPQLSTITDWESHPGSPNHDRPTEDPDGSISSPLLDRE